MDFSIHHHHHHEPEVPITTAYVGLQHHHPPSNGPHNSSSPTTGIATTTTKYRECLKNHAASLGGHALDGCGEFMPSGEDGTPDALRCSACQCHRNFHRKEVEGGDYHPFDLYPPPPPQHHLTATTNTGSRKVVGQKGVLISTNAGSLIPRPTPHQMMMRPMQTSESDEMDQVYCPRVPLVKKRFRTKFTSEQKDRMLEFADRVGWRLPRGEEREVQLFCQEIGVRRRVLKVWMHNNKHTLARKTSIPTTTTTNTNATPAPPE